MEMNDEDKVSNSIFFAPSKFLYLYKIHISANIKVGKPQKQVCETQQIEFLFAQLQI
jgi:hypothetical protein